MVQKKWKTFILRQTDRLLLKKKVLLLLFLIFSVAFFLILKDSFAEDVEIKKVTFQSTKLSYDNKDPGSWKVDASAEWISNDTARLTFNLNSISMQKEAKPIDLVLLVDDTLNIDGLKNRIRAFGRTFLRRNTDNSLAVIKFNSVAEIVSDFGTDINELVSSTYGNLDGSTGLSYYEALNSLNELLENSVNHGNNDVWVVLVTDGYPARDMGKEKEMYSNIRNDFPEIKNFFAVQYNVGNKKSDILKDMSDTQYIGTDLSSFYKIITNIDYMMKYVDYDKFGFNILVNTDIFSIDNIKPDAMFGTTGNVIGARMIWFFGNTDSYNRLSTGLSVKMTFDLKLRDDYKYFYQEVGLYQLLKTVAINYKIGDVSESVVSKDSPFLLNAYQLIYDVNAPSDCTIDFSPDIVYRTPFLAVRSSNRSPACDGYQFKGWKVVDTDVVQYDKSFVMPAHDVTLKASWSKVAINKSMDGTIYKSATLYDIMADNAVLDTNLDFSSTSSSNKGIYTYSSTANDNYPIYYYHGAVTDNNLLFAGFCWKIVRTTDTGGVKIIYNGLPNSSNQCTNTTGNIGSGVFNSNDSSIASVGYMYGSSVSSKEYTNPKWYEALGLTVYTWDMTKTQTMGTGEYYFTSSSSSLRRYNFEGTWILNDSKRATWSTSYTNYYTCLDGSSSCRDPVYIVGGTSTTAKYVPFYMDASSSPSYTGGKYVITDYLHENMVWASSYYNLPNTYVCKDGASSCTEAYYVLSYSTGVIRYISLTGGTTASTLATEASNKKIIFGNWEQWDGTQYILRDTVSVSIMDSYSELSKLSKGYNYTCFSEDTKCASVKYLLSGDDSSITYVDLNAYNLLAFKEAVVFKNTNDSNAKKVIETWYRNNMTSYTKYLEDTVFCNDREVSSGAFSGENGVLDNRPVPFAGYTATKPSLTCNNSYDKFTTSNGLKYPVGLITYGEIFLGGKSAEASYFGTSAFWSMTPRKYGSIAAMYVYNRDFNNAQATWSTKYSNYFRPVVSIKSGMKIDTGNGSSTNPYVLKLT